MSAARKLPQVSGLLAARRFTPTTPASADNLKADLHGSVASPASFPDTPSHGRDLRSIDPHLIDENPFAPREIYTPEMLRERADSLTKHGQRDPIHVIEHPEIAGRYMIADGWTRTQACLVHNALPMLLAEVHHGISAPEAAWLGYEQNESREQHCDLDRAMFYEKQYANGMTPADVARRTKLSKTLLSFYRSYSKLPEEVLKIIRLNPKRFGSTAAHHLSRLTQHCSESKIIALATSYSTTDVPLRWLADQCAQITNSAGRTPIKSIGKTVRYDNGTLRQKGSKFDLSLDLPDATSREAFSLELEQLLAKYGSLEHKEAE